MDRRPSTFRITTELVVVAVAAVYVVAFVSLAVQVGGLVGPDGILPVGEYLDAVRQATGGGPSAWWRAPTLAWLAPGRGGLLTLCLGGVLASVLLGLGIAPLLSASAAWACYLSLVVAGQAFLAFQWDALLLETGFLLLFLVPGGRRRDPDRRSDPWRPALWLLWWLLFRLLLESGLVKMAGGDPVWRDLTALAHHYETQPIPNPVAWYAHRLPMVVQKASTLGTLVIELGVPFLFLLPRRPRMTGGLVVIAHQLLILLTGNFGFFNLLTVALALSLFDDAFWLALSSSIRRGASPSPGSLEPTPEAGSSGGTGGALVVLRRSLAAGFLVVAAGIGCGQVLRSAGARGLPDPVMEAWRLLSPFRVINAYGLFADMTTTRPELVIEGRRGSGPWREIEFRWKPDRPDERPPQVAPYMPRLDWQMWFAALRAERAPADRPERAGYDRWLLRFVERLLAGEPSVWSLLSPENPFRDDREVLRPPDAVRIVLYEYGFTTPDERAATGEWWQRRLIGTYVPPVRRTEDGRLERIPEPAGPSR